MIEAETPYYNELLKIKQDGKLFSFDKITREQLRKLWFDEGIITAMICRLFDRQKEQG